MRLKQRHRPLAADNPPTPSPGRWQWLLALRDRSRGSRRPASWRDYQRSLQRARRVPRRLPSWLVPAACGLAAAILLGVALWERGGSPTAGASHTPPVPTQPEVALKAVLAKADLTNLLGTQVLSRLRDRELQMDFGRRHLTITTTLEAPLQQYLLEHLDDPHARYVAVVVMVPESGRVVALAGRDRDDPTVDPCIGESFPAASIFKIVTAAAALEKAGLKAGSPIAYNGAKHTLYKSQLRDTRNRYTRETTLQDSFAESVNPVFGRIGSQMLGGPALETYARQFGFNRPIPFERLLPESRLVLTDQPYQWAEVASGFNRETTISPLHGAMLAAAVVNDGRMMEPSIVERIVDPDGQVLYTSQPAALGQALSAGAARDMRQMMLATVRRGTARKLFRDTARDRVLAGVEIGGKTGSIDNRSHDLRLDWFVGYATDPAGTSIAVAVLVAHEKFIGRRAATYARMAIKEYFRARSASANAS